MSFNSVVEALELLRPGKWSLLLVTRAEKMKEIFSLLPKRLPPNVLIFMNATAALKARGIRGISLQQDAFSYAMRITCIVTICCAIATLVLAIVKGKAEKSDAGGDTGNAL